MFHSWTDRAFDACGAYEIDTSPCYTAHHSWLSRCGDIVLGPPASLHFLSPAHLHAACRSGRTGEHALSATL